MCVFEYCQVIAREIIKEAAFLQYYQRRFISLRHTGGTKQKTEIERTSPLGTVHDNPDFPLRVSWAKVIQFKNIAS